MGEFVDQAALDHTIGAALRSCGHWLCLYWRSLPAAASCSGVEALMPRIVVNMWLQSSA
jgi:hypothetical protein